MMLGKNRVTHSANNSIPQAEIIQYNRKPNHIDSNLESVSESNSQAITANLPIACDKAQKMAEFFGFLGDANRLRILSLLAKTELCVGDLAATLEMTESAVSHQLRNLRVMRLVSYRKKGRNVFYSLHDSHILHLYQAVAEHLDEEGCNQEFKRE